MSDDDVDTNVISDLLSILLVPFQEVESVFQQLLTECDVNTAVGAQLDVVGALVGCRRRGLADDVYRRHIRATVSVNKSSGTIDQLIGIARLIVFDDSVDVDFQNVGTAAYNMILLGAVPTDTASSVATLSQRATSAGVRGIVQYGTGPTSGWFRFDSGPGFDVGHLTTGIG